MKSEPVLILAVINAAIALLASFGFSLSAQQVGAVSALSTAVFAIVTRTQVSPAH